MTCYLQQWFEFEYNSRFRFDSLLIGNRDTASSMEIKDGGHNWSVKKQIGYISNFVFMYNDLNNIL